MKKSLFSIALLFGSLVFASTSAFGQTGSLKYCPNTLSWKSNKQMVEDAKTMYEEYAKGPEGCWYMKVAKHASYSKGMYTFDYDGKEKYYFDGKNWQNEKKTSCLAQSPFGK